MPIKPYLQLVRGERGRTRPEFFEGVPLAGKILVFAAAVVTYFAVSALFTWLLPTSVTQDFLGEVIPRMPAVVSAALVFVTGERFLAHPAETTEHPAEGAGSR